MFIICIGPNTLNGSVTVGIIDTRIRYILSHFTRENSIWTQRWRRERVVRHVGVERQSGHHEVDSAVPQYEPCPEENLLC